MRDQTRDDYTITELDQLLPSNVAAQLPSLSILQLANEIGSEAERNQVLDDLANAGRLPTFARGQVELIAWRLQPSLEQQYWRQPHGKS